MTVRWIASLLLLVPSGAVAQEARRFDAKALAVDFPELAIYGAKNTVVDQEVTFSIDDGKRMLQAIYLVRADLKQVLAFYRAKLAVAPTREGDEALGTVKHIFSAPSKPEARDRFKVVVEASEEPGRVQITLVRKRVPDEELIE